MIKPKPLISKMWRPPPDLSERSEKYRFDRNERTTLFTKDQFNDIISTISPYDLVAYGELEPFYKKVSSYLNVKRSELLLASGSDSGIKSIFETFISPKDKILITLPNYAMFSVYTSMFGAKEVQFFHNSEMHIDCEALLDKINLDLKMLIISNPSHTGKIIEESRLIELIKKAQNCDVLVLIDEAYFHFYNKSMVPYINQFKNLIITRTFSKAVGIASLRIGILISNKYIISELYKVKLVHEVTGLAAKIGSYLIENKNIIDDYVLEVNLGKSILYKRLEPYVIKIFTSESNFVFFKLKKHIDAKTFLTYLEQKKIFIKGPFEKHPFDNHFRITVGSRKQMMFFCDTFEDFIGK